MFSIIIPVFNAEPYLKNCVDSILRQDCNEYEIILVNDGSVDRSGEICDDYSKNNCNIKTIHCVNQGVSNARNQGIREAHGKYIIFIDADDEISDGYFKKIVNSDYQRSDLLITDVLVVNEKRNILKRLGPEKEQYLNKEMIRELLVSLDATRKSWLLEFIWNKVYSRQIIVENNLQFNEKISLGEDFIFNCQYFRYVNNILLITQSPYFYFQRAGVGLTRKFRFNELERRKLMCNTIIELFRFWGILEKKLEDIKLVEGQYGYYSLNSIFLKDCGYGFHEKRGFIKELFSSEYHEYIQLYLKNNAGLKSSLWRLLIKWRMKNVYIIINTLNNLRKV